MKLRAPEALGDRPRKAMVCPTNASLYFRYNGPNGPTAAQREVLWSAAIF